MTNLCTIINHPFDIFCAYWPYDFSDNTSYVPTEAQSFLSHPCFLLAYPQLAHRYRRGLHVAVRFAALKRNVSTSRPCTIFQKTDGRGLVQAYCDAENAAVYAYLICSASRLCCADRFPRDFDSAAQEWEQQNLQQQIEGRAA